VLDLFCGAGFFALALARRCKAVYGYEVSAAAVADACANAAANGIGNAVFERADLDEGVPAACGGGALPPPHVVVAGAGQRSKSHVVPCLLACTLLVVHDPAAGCDLFSQMSIRIRGAVCWCAADARHMLVHPVSGKSTAGRCDIISRVCDLICRPGAGGHVAQAARLAARLRRASHCVRQLQPGDAGALTTGQPRVFQGTTAVEGCACSSIRSSLSLQQAICTFGGPAQSMCGFELSCLTR